MGKKQECEGCIGLTDEHTCEGWNDFQAKKTDMMDVVPRSQLTAARVEIGQITKQRDEAWKTIRNINEQREDARAERGDLLFAGNQIWQPCPCCGKMNEISGKRTLPTKGKILGMDVTVIETDSDDAVFVQDCKVVGRIVPGKACYCPATMEDGPVRFKCIGEDTPGCKKSQSGKVSGRINRGDECPECGSDNTVRLVLSSGEQECQPCGHVFVTGKD